MVHSVEQIRRLLQAEGIRGVQNYCAKLNPNLKTPTVYRDLLSEAYAGLMFARSGFGVMMRESPDLDLDCNGITIGAEVKRFHKKKQDDIDDRRMVEAEDLIRYGDTTPTEGEEAWKQVEDVALKKCSQLSDGIPNILVIESSSRNCIANTEIMIAANSMSDRNAKGSTGDTTKLNGFVFLSLQFKMGDWRNVFFYEIDKSAIALPVKARRAMKAINEWKMG